MAYALVGSLGSVATNGVNTPAFGQATTAGNLLIAWVAVNSVSAASLTGTGWTQAVEVVSGSSHLAAVWYRANCGASESAPTFSNWTFGMLGEFSGGATSSPVDQTGSNSGASSPVVAACSLADTASGELFVSADWIGLSKSGTQTSSDTYNNATPSGNANNDATSTTSHYRFAYGITTANASADQTSIASGSMNLSVIAGAVASFKLAAAAAATSFVAPSLLRRQPLILR